LTRCSSSLLRVQPDALTWALSFSISVFRSATIISLLSSFLWACVTTLLQVFAKCRVLRVSVKLDSAGDMAAIITVFELPLSESCSR